MSLIDWMISAGMVVLIVILIALPPHIDPAIRWKERNERKRDE